MAMANGGNLKEYALASRSERFCKTGGLEAWRLCGQCSASNAFLPA